MPTPEGQRAILLAASYPPRRYMEGSDSHEIAAAVKALAGAAFHKGWTIVFGGHPTISPLILMIAREYDQKDRVVIYQSAYFQNHIGPATQSLARERYGHIEFVPNHPDEPPPAADEKLDPTKCPRSLTMMRESMMQHPGIAALVLVGGDTGLRQELDLFVRRHEDLPVIPIGHPGGIAREMAGERRMPGEGGELAEAAHSSPHYLLLCNRLMQYLEQRPATRR